jgi:hypothetical protein
VRLLDLFCGRWGWSRAFAKRGWECFGVDLTEPPEIPEHCHFQKKNVLDVNAYQVAGFDFIVASSPCEEFSVHGMKHFHPHPKYPENGIRLFNHTREILEASGVPYVMENVRAAQQFVGNAVHHCGPFYLWGNAVPPLLNQGIVKVGGDKSGQEVGRMTPEQKAAYRKAQPRTFPEHSQRLRERYGMTVTSQAWSGSKARAELTARVATIPPELANTVADYAEALIRQRSIA